MFAIFSKILRKGNLNEVPHCRKDIKAGATRCPFCEGAIAYGESLYERGYGLAYFYVPALIVFVIMAWLDIKDHGFMGWIGDIFSIKFLMVQVVFPIGFGLALYVGTNDVRKG